MLRIHISGFSVAVVVLCCALSSCHDVQKNAPAAKHAPGSFDALREQYADVIRTFPDSPQSETVLRLLLDAASQRQQGTEAEAADWLMYQFADENLGLYLFDKRRKEADAVSGNGALDLCHAVQKKAPLGSPLSLAAFDAELSRLEKDTPDSFLTVCGETIAAIPEDPRLRVALLRRANYYRDMGEAKKSALDFIRFWSEYPDKVSDMELAVLIETALRNAGLVFESGLLEVSPDSGATARELMAAFEPFMVQASGGKSAAPASPSLDIYFNNTPDIAAITQAMASLQDTIEGTEEPLLLHLRIGALHVQASDVQESIEAFTGFADALAGTIESLPKEEAVLARLRTYSAYTVSTLERISKAFSGPTAKRGGSNLLPRSHDLYLRVLDLDLELAAAIANVKGQDGAEYFFSSVKTYTDKATAWNDRKRPVLGYRRYVELYPDSKDAPRALLALAEFYEASGTPSQACEIYTEFAEKYPNSPQAAGAALKRALALYESQKYDESYEACQLLMTQYPSSTQVVPAEFLAALCEAGLGMVDQARDHVTSFVERFPQDDLSARALYWLGSSYLSEQNYEKALSCFSDLIARFPEKNEFVSRAREHVANLSRMQESKTPSPK